MRPTRDELYEVAQEGHTLPVPKQKALAEEALLYREGNYGTLKMLLERAAKLCDQPGPLGAIRRALDQLEPSQTCGRRIGVMECKKQRWHTDACWFVTTLNVVSVQADPNSGTCRGCAVPIGNPHHKQCRMLGGDGLEGIDAQSPPISNEEIREALENAGLEKGRLHESMKTHGASNPRREVQCNEEEIRKIWDAIDSIRSSISALGERTAGLIKY